MELLVLDGPAAEEAMTRNYRGWAAVVALVGSLLAPVRASSICVWVVRRVVRRWTACRRKW